LIGGEFMGLFDFFKKHKDEDWFEIYSPLDGTVVDLSEVPDPAFAEKMVGDGCAINPAPGSIYAPVAGDVSIFPTNHAASFETANGLEMIVHFGVDTVKLDGQGFTRVSDADHVNMGDELVKYDLDYIKENAKSVLTPVLINNMDMVEELKIVAQGPVKHGDLLMKVKVKKS
jgi:PTS system glucose-specific IIA component